MRKTALIFLLGAAGLLTATRSSAQSSQTIYAEALASGWADWSWAAVNFAATSPVHAGSRSISVTAGAWEALFLHSNSAFDPAGYTNLSFWINGGPSGGQLLQVQAVLGGDAVDDGIQLAALPQGTWQQINAPMSSLVPPGQSQIDGFWIQSRSGNAQPVFYVDDLLLMAGTNPPTPPATNPTVTVRVDAAAGRHPISPEIYGVAFASSNQLKELNVPLNRSGGNTTTRYNWQINAANRAADWYFESIGSSSSAAGRDGDDFIADSRAAGAEAMLTIPTLGWVAKLGPNRAYLVSFSIAKYGPQTDNDWEWFPDAGNGISTAAGNPYITNNTPTDANVPADTNFQSGWVRHLTNRWSTAASGGLRYYILDNEPSIWHSTHRDVHPVGATMQEVRNYSVSYAKMIKALDPGAQIVGPEEWGWSGYFYSGYDLQWGAAHQWSSFPDRSTNGGWDYLPWYLDQMRQQSAAAGQRLLDVFTVHYYPQGGEYSSTVTASLQERRNRSTRSLWDPNYTDETWIGDEVQLIPRLKAWVAAHYPGTRIGVTEYSWGADDHINGATAQADVLGIFGREGLDLATRWVVPDTGTPAYNAVKMYRNYDGNKSAFGETAVTATVPDPDNLAAFAATRAADGALTVMVINKVLSGTTPLALALTNFAGTGTAQVWQLTSANVIQHLPDVSFAGGTLSNTLPAQSLTLFVLPAAAPFRLRAGAVAAGQFTLWLDGQAGQTYVLQSSSNLVQWSPASTNTLSSNSFPFVIPTGGSAHRFYRARWIAP